MRRSLCVHPDYLTVVKSAFQRCGYMRQGDFATEVGIAPATLKRYLAGQRVDRENFFKISQQLGLEWQKIAQFEEETEEVTAGKSLLEPISPNGTLSGDRFGTEDMQGLPPVPLLNNGADINSSTKVQSFYVERPPIESQCYAALLNPETLLRIRAPKQMGKTFLVRRLLAQLVQHHYRTVHLSLDFATGNDLANLQEFLRWLCVSVTQRLGLQNRLEDYWDEQFSTPKMNCTDYFESYLLAQQDSPLVLCLDNIDRIFLHEELAEEFLGLLRAWHEQSKLNQAGVWKQFRLILVHSTEVYIRLQATSSPFNVAQTFELPEFIPEQVQELAQKHGLDWTIDDVMALMREVGGHPYLIDLACFSIKSHQVSLEQLLHPPARGAKIYRNHLHDLWSLIEQQEDLIEATKALVSTDRPVALTANQTRQLDSLGVVRVQNSGAILRCHLYRQYFHHRLQEIP